MRGARTQSRVFSPKAAPILFCCSSTCRFPTWWRATRGRKSPSGPPPTPPSWRTAKKRWARSATRGRQSSLHDNLLNPLLRELENVFVLCRTAPCRTVSLWGGACCFCSSSTRACCPSCRWERAYCSSTCRVSSTGVGFIEQLWHNKPDRCLS